MGSTLEHGIYLPSEGEKNCYQGLAGNWNKVDGALGDIAELKQSIESKFTKEIVTELPTEDINPFCIYMILKTDPETDNVYDEWVYINNAWEYLGNTKVDMTQYYTKQEVNQLPAVASGVTATKVGNYDAHIANGDIHVTASDKTKWTNSANTHVLRLALSALTPSTSNNSFSNLDDSTALKVGDKVMDTAGGLFEVTAIDTQNSTFTIGTPLTKLAVDSDVVHKSGDETVDGNKTFNGSTNCVGELKQTAPFKMTADTSFITGSKNTSIYDQNGFQCAYEQIIYNNSKNIRQSWSINNNGSGTTVSAGFNLILSASGTKIFYPISDSDTDNGSSSAYWKNTYTKRINNLEPSSLSLPSGNVSDVIDISSYLTILDGSNVNTYVAPANGWISILMNNCSSVQGYITGLWGHQIFRPSAGSVRFLMPVLKNQTANILVLGGTIGNARFIPCQGNV